MVSACSGDDISLIDLWLHPRSLFVRGHMVNIAWKKAEVSHAFLWMEKTISIDPNNYMKIWFSFFNLV
jgi:hypothetical protein